MWKIGLNVDQPQEIIHYHKSCRILTITLPFSYFPSFLLNLIIDQFQLVMGNNEKYSFYDGGSHTSFICVPGGSHVPEALLLLLNHKYCYWPNL